MWVMPCPDLPPAGRCSQRSLSNFCFKTNQGVVGALAAGVAVGRRATVATDWGFRIQAPSHPAIAQGVGGRAPRNGWSSGTPRRLSCFSAIPSRLAGNIGRQGIRKSTQTGKQIPPAAFGLESKFLV